MKTNLSLYVDVETAAALDAAAQKTGVSRNRLVDVLIRERLLLRPLPEPAAKPKEPPHPKLKPSEADVFAALTGEWKPFLAVVQDCGRSIGVVSRALERLYHWKMIEDHIPDSVPSWKRGKELELCQQWRRCSS